MKNEVLREIIEEQSEIVILRGQLMNPVACSTKGKGEKYYTFELKVLKRMSDDAYGVGFNMYHMVMPVDVSKQFNDTEIAGLKGSEIIATCELNARTKKLDSGAIVNNVSLYASEIEFVRNISKVKGTPTYL